MEPRSAVLKSCEDDIAASATQAEAGKLKREKLEEQLEGTRKELQEIAAAMAR
jgi:F0F1-type ATP synthase membrane subunit b/b'